MTEFKPAGCVSELHLYEKTYQAEGEKSHCELTCLSKVRLSVRDSHSNLPRPDLQQLYISPLLPTKRALMGMFVVNGLKSAVPYMAETNSQGLRMRKNKYFNTEEATGTTLWFGVLARDIWPIGSGNEPSTFLSPYQLFPTAILISCIYI